MQLTALTPVPPQILTERVYEAIKALLMDQRIEPGSRINIERLARDLRVSATPVREGLARLESDGLVVKQALRGYTSTPLIEPATFAQLFEMRLLIEPFAAARAAKLGRPEDFDVLDAIVVTMNREPPGESYAEYRDFGQHDAKFHTTIARVSGNAILHETLVRLRPHMHLNRLHFQSGPAIEANREHERIVIALRRRDADGAASAMRDHLEQSCARLQPAATAMHAAAAAALRRTRSARRSSV